MLIMYKSHCECAKNTKTQTMMKYRVHTDVLLQHNFMLNELAISNEFVQFYSMKMYDLYVKHKGP